MKLATHIHLLTIQLTSFSSSLTELLAWLQTLSVVTLKMGEMTLCTAKVVACSVKPTHNYYLTLLFPSALQGV